MLKITQNSGVRTISLDRPEKRNAFGPEMIQALTKAFTNLDANVRAIILTGEGASFCAGGDLGWMKSMADFTLEENVRDAEALFDMYFAIRAAPVPVLGRVFGHAFGGGAGLLAVCDITAAEEKTQISFSEVKWGLVPAVISPFVTERATPARVREWFVTAKVFSAREALDGGLVNFTGTIDEVDGYLEKRVREILAAAPGAVRDTKQLHQSYSPIDWKQARTRCSQLIAARRVGAEGQRGLKAFLDKRDPKWSDDGPPKV